MLWGVALADEGEGQEGDVSGDEPCDYPLVPCHVTGPHSRHLYLTALADSRMPFCSERRDAPTCRGHTTGVAFNLQEGGCGR